MTDRQRGLLLHSISVPQRRHRLADDRIADSPILAAAREQLHPIVPLAGDQAVTVKPDLVIPPRPTGGLNARVEMHGLIWPSRFASRCVRDNMMYRKMTNRARVGKAARWILWPR
jgi:hypothetical protein